MKSSRSNERLLVLCLILGCIAIAIFWPKSEFNTTALASSTRSSRISDHGSALRQVSRLGGLSNAAVARHKTPARVAIEKGLRESVRPMSVSRHQMGWVRAQPEESLNLAHFASNQAQRMDFSLSKEGLEIMPANGSGNDAWRLGMRLSAVGYVGSLSALSDASPKADGNRVEVSRVLKDRPTASVVEWYVNTHKGLEQGFTLNSPPGTNARGSRLRVDLSLTGSLKAALDETGQEITFSSRDGRKVVRYDHLAVSDAAGRSLDAGMALDNSCLSLLVDDRGAKYPITIDPVFSEVKKLTASNAAEDDLFGSSIAISGDTIVVGAPFRASETGAAFVYERDQGGSDNWGEVKVLVSSDAAAGDKFGTAVSISGDTIVVTAEGDNGSNGAAYVFERNLGGPGNWGQSKKLITTTGTSAGHFGTAVGINANTLVVGAAFESFLQGAAYVFERDRGGAGAWGEARKLLASTGATGDEYGISVSINADSIVVGADLNDGTKGSAFVYSRNAGGANNWGETRILQASDGAPGDNFGTSVEIETDTIVVGAILDDLAKGSVYVFDRNAGGTDNWGEVKKLVASDGAESDNFGNSAAINGDIVVVGAGGHDFETGAAYVFGRNTGGLNNWGEIEKLAASDGNVSDQFGYSVAVSDATIVVGAHVDDLAKGAAYVFGPGNDGSIPIVRLNPATIQRGQTGTVSIDLVAVGGPNPQNKIRFSVTFDPKLLSFVSAVPGSDAGTALLTIDSSVAASGRVGFTLAHNPGDSFAPGTNQIVVITLQALAGGTAPLTASTFINTPQGRQLLSVSGTPLTAFWDNGSVTMEGQCELNLSPQVAHFSSAGGPGQISVASSDVCTWGGVSNDTAFITITNGVTGSGVGTVTYTVAPNAGPARSGTINIAGQLVIIRQGALFADVDPNSPFATFIGKISAAGITLGCGQNALGQPLYCPSNNVTREQMAAFIIRALGEFTPPTPTSQRFLDVPPSNGFYAFVDRMAIRQITLGCGNGTIYCPSNNVTREQMAAFLIRALGEFTPPTPTSQRFLDVPPSNVFYAFIDRMAARQITLGCGNGTIYCPGDNVTREQMAAFLARAFGL